MSSLRTIKDQASWQPYNPDYAELLNALPAAVYVCDLEGYIRSYNEAAVKLWGRRPLIGTDQWWCGPGKVYEPDGTPVPADRWPITRTLNTGKPVAVCEFIIERPDLERFHVLAQPNLIFNESGEPKGAVNILIDISPTTEFDVPEAGTRELTRTMEALRRSEEQYHLMVAEVQDYAIFMLSEDGIVQNWNKGAQKIKGYSEAEIVGKSFRIFYTPEDQASGLPDRLIALARENGKANHEGWRVRKDGTRFWGSISLTALHDSEGNVVGFSKVTRDLTERREAELRIQQYNEDLRLKNELLRQSEECYHRMVSEVEDYVIILLDVDGYIQNWNKGAQKIKGYSAEEILGKHFSIFYSAEDRKKGIPEKVLHEAAESGKSLHEGWRLRKDGSAFWGSVVMTALHNDDDKLIGFTKVTRDLTDKKMTEERLRATSLKLEEKNKELERMNEELSSFAYISSHDLQEPLRKIQTFSDRILELEYNSLSDKGKDYFERMQRGAQRMQKLIRDILAYSRTTTSDKRLEETDLNDILTQSKNELEIQISEKKAIIESRPLPTLKVIPFQIQQLFNNLLSNALKFSKPDVPPHIVIASETVDAESVRGVYSSSSNRYLHISVADNGIGFEPIYEKKIFEVFQRLHGRAEYGGTGIGLAICKKIVENHHGVLTAESIPNEGATFHIYLPFAG